MSQAVKGVACDSQHSVNQTVFFHCAAPYRDQNRIANKPSKPKDIKEEVRADKDANGRLEHNGKDTGQLAEPASVDVHQ